MSRFPSISKVRSQLTEAAAGSDFFGYFDGYCNTHFVKPLQAEIPSVRIKHEEAGDNTAFAYFSVSAPGKKQDGLIDGFIDLNVVNGSFKFTVRLMVDEFDKPEFSWEQSSNDSIASLVKPAATAIKQFLQRNYF